MKPSLITSFFLPSLRQTASQAKYQSNTSRDDVVCLLYPVCNTLEQLILLLKFIEPLPNLNCLKKMEGEKKGVSEDFFWVFTRVLIVWECFFFSHSGIQVLRCNFNRRENEKYFFLSNKSAKKVPFFFFGLNIQLLSYVTDDEQTEEIICSLALRFKQQEEKNSTSTHKRNGFLLSTCAAFRKVSWKLMMCTFWHNP